MLMDLGEITLTAKTYGIVLALLTSGCAVTLSQKAEQVQVHRQVSNLLDSCKRIGPVKGAGTSMMSPAQAELEASVKLRESAADIGGDTVAILHSDDLTHFTTWEVRMQGIAFKCY
jgi:hypothetical protein